MHGTLYLSECHKKVPLALLGSNLIVFFLEKAMLCFIALKVESKIQLRKHRSMENYHHGEERKRNPPLAYPSNNMCVQPHNPQVIAGAVQCKAFPMIVKAIQEFLHGDRLQGD
jgi:hypothetical protein